MAFLARGSALAAAAGIVFCADAKTQSVTEEKTIQWFGPTGVYQYRVCVRLKSPASLTLWTAARALVVVGGGGRVVVVVGATVVVGASVVVVVVVVVVVEVGSGAAVVVGSGVVVAGSVVVTAGVLLSF